MQHHKRLHACNWLALCTRQHLFHPHLMWDVLTPLCMLHIASSSSRHVHEQLAAVSAPQLADHCTCCRSLQQEDAALSAKVPLPVNRLCRVRQWLSEKVTALDAEQAALEGKQMVRCHLA